MTDSKKRARSQSGTKEKKLQLNKETLKDLSASTDRARQLKGGAQGTATRCSGWESGCRF